MGQLNARQTLACMTQGFAHGTSSTAPTCGSPTMRLRYRPLYLTMASTLSSRYHRASRQPSYQSFQCRASTRRFAWAMSLRSQVTQAGPSQGALALTFLRAEQARGIAVGMPKCTSSCRICSLAGGLRLPACICCDKFAR